jgi:hypothetical protein
MFTATAIANGRMRAVQAQLVNFTGGEAGKKGIMCWGGVLCSFQHWEGPGQYGWRATSLGQGGALST